MKRYEDFNRTFKKNDSAEEQAIDMILEEIRQEYGIDNLRWAKHRFLGQVNWLNAELCPECKGDIKINEYSPEDKPYILRKEYRCKKCNYYWYKDE